MEVADKSPSFLNVIFPSALLNINLFKNSTFLPKHLLCKFFYLSLHPSKCVLWGGLYLLINKI